MPSTVGIINAQVWLQRAGVHTQIAIYLAEKGDPNLLVEAVSQLQQACEKATKGVMLANGISYDEVKGMGHNTIGAFINLISQMMGNSQLSEGLSLPLVTKNAAGSVYDLTRLVWSGSRNKATRDKVRYAFKQVLRTPSENLGNKAVEVAEWRRLTRAFPPEVVELFIEVYAEFRDKLREYINEVPVPYVDPRPLLAGEVDAETWVFSSSHAGLPKRFPGQETDPRIDPIFAKVAQELVSVRVEQQLRHIDRRHWPGRVNIREVLHHIGNWLTALSWLFLCATVTTPHAVSSRYPAEEGRARTEMGSQDYRETLGIVACIRQLAINTDEAIQNLKRHYRQVSEDYRQMLR